MLEIYNDFKEVDEYIEYKVEFKETIEKNFSFEALGGKNPKELIWSLDSEPLSTSTYNTMRGNIFQLCIDTVEI